MGLLEPIIALGKTLVQVRDEVKLLRYEIDALKTRFDRFDRDAASEIRELHAQLDRLKEAAVANHTAEIRVVENPARPSKLPTEDDTSAPKRTG